MEDSLKYINWNPHTLIPQHVFKKKNLYKMNKEFKIEELYFNIFFE